MWTRVCPRKRQSEAGESIHHQLFAGVKGNRVDTLAPTGSSLARKNQRRLPVNGDVGDSPGKSSRLLLMGFKVGPGSGLTVERPDGLGERCHWCGVWRAPLRPTSYPMRPERWLSLGDPNWIIQLGRGASLT